MRMGFELTASAQANKSAKAIIWLTVREKESAGVEKGILGFPREFQCAKKWVISRNGEEL